MYAITCSFFVCVYIIRCSCSLGGVELRVGIGLGSLCGCCESVIFRRQKLYPCLCVSVMRLTRFVPISISPFLSFAFTFSSVHMVFVVHIRRSLEWCRFYYAALQTLCHIHFSRSWCIRSSHSERNKNSERNDDATDSVHDDALVCPFRVFGAALTRMRIL